MLLLYSFDHNFRVSFAALAKDFDYKVDFYLFLVSSFLSMLLFVWLFRHILPLFNAKFSLPRGFVIATCSMALGLASFSVCQALVQGPVNYLLGFSSPPTVPLEVTLEPTGTAIITNDITGVPRLSQRARFIIERKITEAENLVLPRLQVSSGGMGRSEPGSNRIGLYEGQTGTVKGDGRALVYSRIVREVDRDIVCGKSLLVVASDVLGLNSNSITLVGDDTKKIECGSEDRGITVPAYLLFQESTFDVWLFLAYGFSMNTRTVYTYEIKGWRGIEFRTGFYIDKVLSRDKTEIVDRHKFEDLKNLLDVRKIEVPLRAKIIKAQATMDIINTLLPQLFLALPAIGILTLMLGTRIRPLHGDEWICKLLLERPLHVLALLFFLVMASLSALLSLARL